MCVVLPAGKEVEQLARLITAYGNDSKLGNVEEVTDVSITFYGIQWTRDLF